MGRGFDKHGTWYLLAGTPAGSRTFRVDRVVSLAVTDQAAEVPSGIDVDQVWADVVARVEALRSTTWATVEVPQGLVGVLRAQFGRHTSIEAVGDGRARVRVGAPNPLDLARHLAGWGAQAEVAESTEVRAELARLGTELVQRYGTAAADGP